MRILPESLQQIIDDISAASDLYPSDVIKIVKEANVPFEDLRSWLDFDHSPADSYGRKMLCKASNFEVMVMSWMPGDYSAIHDHGYTTWGAVKVFGAMEHATFRIKEGMIYTLDRRQFESGQVIGVNHDLIHQMGNPTDHPIATLHIYGVEKTIDSVTGDTRLYDLASNEIQIIDGGVFFDLEEAKINTRLSGPVGDFPTRLRHMVELANRISKKNPNDERIESLAKEVVASIDKVSSDSYRKYLSQLEAGAKISTQEICERELQAAESFLQAFDSLTTND